MRSRSDTKRARLEMHLAELRPPVIDDKVWSELRTRLAPVSNTYLRKLVISTGLPMSPVVEGVRHDSLQHAARTLMALSTAYADSEADSRRRIREAVIESKDRLRWALKRSSATDSQVLKQEILLWVMTWLENPAVFPAWLALRRQAEAVASAR
jgi:hypothetical protein